MVQNSERPKSSANHEVVVGTAEGVLDVEAAVEVDLDVKAGFADDVPDALGPVGVLVAAAGNGRRDVSGQTVKDAAAAG